MLVLWGVIELNIGVSLGPLPVPNLVADFDQIILTCIPTLGPLLPCFQGTTIPTPSKNRAYQLSSIHPRGAASVPSTSYDKYGDYRPDFENKGVNASDSSSQEDTIRLKDANVIASGYGTREEHIVKTTDIRVSVDDPERPGDIASMRGW